MAHDALEAGAIKTRASALATYRDPYVNRAYDYAAVTLPYLISQTEDRTSEEQQLDYNSLGAEMVNHLANRYVQELFPPARSFFKLRVGNDEPGSAPQTAPGASTSGNSAQAQQEALLAAGERAARWKFEERHGRVAALEGLKHCIVTGNALLAYPRDDEGTGRIQLYALDEYYLMRSPDGAILEIITEDKKALAALDPELRAQVISGMQLSPDDDMSKTNVIIYTYIRIDPENSDQFLVDQQVENIPIQEASTEIPKDKLPWIPLVWNRTRREIYGRGLVEDHYASFWALSILVEAIVTGGAIMTDFKFLVKPGSMLDVVEMNQAASGTYHYGDPDDVSAIETGKTNDFKFIFELIKWYQQSLGRVFLMVSTQMRDAERVTAEENRMRAMELETAHGGVFSNYALTFQSPMAALLMNDVEVDVTKDGVNPVVVTGLDAMGRTADNEKIMLLFQDLTVLNNIPDEVRARLRPADLITILANGRDVESNKFYMNEQEYATAQQNAGNAQAGAMATQELMKKAGPEQLAQGIAQSAQQGG